MYWCLGLNKNFGRNISETRILHYNITYVLYRVLCLRKKIKIKLGESVTLGLSHKEMIAILSYVQGIYNKY